MTILKFMSLLVDILMYTWMSLFLPGMLFSLNGSHECTDVSLLFWPPTIYTSWFNFLLFRDDLDSLNLTSNIKCWQKVQCLTYKSCTKVVPSKKVNWQNVTKWSILRKNSKLPIWLTMKTCFAYIKKVPLRNRRVILAKFQLWHVMKGK